MLLYVCVCQSTCAFVGLSVCVCLRHNSGNYVGSGRWGGLWWGAGGGGSRRGSSQTIMESQGFVCVKQGAGQCQLLLSTYPHNGPFSTHRNMHTHKITYTWCISMRLTTTVLYSGGPWQKHLTCVPSHLFTLTHFHSFSVSCSDTMVESKLVEEAVRR